MTDNAQDMRDPVDDAIRLEHIEKQPGRTWEEKQHNSISSITDELSQISIGHTRFMNTLWQEYVEDQVRGEEITIDRDRLYNAILDNETNEEFLEIRSLIRQDINRLDEMIAKSQAQRAYIDYQKSINYQPRDFNFDV